MVYDMVICFLHSSMDMQVVISYTVRWQGCLTMASVPSVSYKLDLSLICNSIRKQLWNLGHHLSEVIS